MIFLKSKTSQSVISSVLIVSTLLPSMMMATERVYAADEYTKCNFDDLVAASEDLATIEKKLVADPNNIGLQHLYVDKKYEVDKVGDSIDNFCRKILYDSGNYPWEAVWDQTGLPKSADTKRQILLRSYAIEAVANHLSDGVALLDQAIAEVDSYLKELPATTSVPILRNIAYSIAEKQVKEEEDKVRRSESSHPQPCRCTMFYKNGGGSSSEQIFWVENERQCTIDTVNHLKSVQGGGGGQDFYCRYAPGTERTDYTDTNMVADQIFDKMMTGFQETPYYTLGLRNAMILRSALKSLEEAVRKIQGGTASVNNISKFLSGDLIGLIIDAKVPAYVDDVEFAKVHLGDYFEALRKIYRASYLGNSTDYNSAEAEALFSIARELDTNKSKSFIVENTIDIYDSYAKDLPGRTNIGAGYTAGIIYKNVSELYKDTDTAEKIRGILTARKIDSAIISLTNDLFMVVGVVAAFYSYGLALVIPVVQGSLENYFVWDQYESKIEQQYGTMPVFLLRLLSGNAIFEFGKVFVNSYGPIISNRLLAMSAVGSTKFSELVESTMSSGSLSKKSAQMERLVYSGGIGNSAPEQALMLKSMGISEFTDGVKMRNLDAAPMPSSGDQVVFGSRLINWIKSLFSKQVDVIQDIKSPSMSPSISSSEQFFRMGELIKSLRDSGDNMSGSIKTVGGISGDFSGGLGVKPLDVNVGIVIEASSANVASTMLASKLRAVGKEISKTFGNGIIKLGVGDNAVVFDATSKSVDEIAGLLSSGKDDFIQLTYKDPKTGYDIKFNVYSGYHNTLDSRIYRIGSGAGTISTDQVQLASDVYIMPSGEGNYDLALYRKLGMEVYGMDPLSLAAERTRTIVALSSYDRLMKEYVNKDTLFKVIEAVDGVVRGADSAGDEILTARAKKTYTAISKISRFKDSPPIRMSALEPLMDLYEIVHDKPWSESDPVLIEGGNKDPLWQIIYGEIKAVFKRGDVDAVEFLKNRYETWEKIDPVVSQYIARAAKRLKPDVDRVLLASRAINARQKLSGDFDPEAEVKNILTQSTADRPKALELFKEKLDMQLQAFANVEAELIHEIENNLDASPAELRSLVKARGQASGLNNKQINELLNSVNVFKVKNDVIRRITTGKSDSEIYEAIFKAKPVGKIQIVKGGGTLYFRCENLEDYSRMNYQIFDGSPVTTKMKEAADKSGGVKLVIPGSELDGILIAEKSTGGLFDQNPLDKKTWPNKVMRHERRHAYHSAISQPEVAKLELKIKSIVQEFELDARKPEGAERPEYYRTKRRTFEGYVYAERALLADQNAADEFLAYLRDGSDPQDIYNTLMKVDGLYQRDLNDALAKVDRTIAKISNRILDPDFEHTIRDDLYEITGRIFGSDYAETVQGGAKAMISLLEAGLSRDQVINRFSRKPLRDWGKTAKRILEQRSSDTQ